MEKYYTLADYASRKTTWCMPVKYDICIDGTNFRTGCSFILSLSDIDGVNLIAKGLDRDKSWELGIDRRYNKNSESMYFCDYSREIVVHIETNKEIQRMGYDVEISIGDGPSRFSDINPHIIHLASKHSEQKFIKAEKEEKEKK